MSSTNGLRPFEVVRSLPRADDADAKAVDARTSWLDDDMRAYGETAIDVHTNGPREERICSTGIATLDELIGGFFPGQSHIVAGRTGAGKTSFATHATMKLALAAQATDGPPVLFFSLEMTPEDMAARAISWFTRIPQDSVVLARYRRVLSEDQMEQVSRAHRFATRRVRVVATADVTPSAIRAAARRAKAAHGASAIVVDYLGLIEPEGGSATRGTTREREVATASRALKAMAMELDLPVVVLCQLGRAAEREKEPRLSLLRESGAIENDASLVLFLWPTNPPEPGRSRLVVAKRRFGAPWVETVARFDGATGYFDDEQEVGRAARDF